MLEGEKFLFIVRPGSLFYTGTLPAKLGVVLALILNVRWPTIFLPRLLNVVVRAPIRLWIPVSIMSARRLGVFTSRICMARALTLHAFRVWQKNAFPPTPAGLVGLIPNESILIAPTLPLLTVCASGVCALESREAPTLVVRPEVLAPKPRQTMVARLPVRGIDRLVLLS